MCAPPGYQEYMSDLPNDETRLRATEAQMRRALGLGDSTTPRIDPPAVTQGSGGAPRPPRRFVRDGDVAVTLVQRDRPPDGAVNQLDAARQAIRSQAAAREHAERLLQEARAAIRDLQTKLTHANLARDEAEQRTEKQLQAVRAELATEQAARQQAEAALAAAEKARPEPEPPSAPAEVTPRRRGRPPKQARPEPELPLTPAAAPRRQGRPPKVEQPETEFVEWWKPGWQNQFR
jgi:hypothetical protein